MPISKCKHKWVYGEKRGLAIIILCEKCGIIREIYADGYSEQGKSKGVYA